MNVTKLNYYSNEANKHYAGYSQIKSFSQCEARCLAEINGKYEREETTSLLVGSYIDEYFNGGSDFLNFVEQHPEMFKRDGTLKSEFEKAGDIIRRIERDDVLHSYLTGERQVIMTGAIMGVPIKIKIDSLKDDKIVDGKVMKDFSDVWSDEDNAYVPFWRAYSYDWQAFIYQEIVRQNTGKTLPFVLAAATKEKVPLIRAYKFSNETIANARIEVCNILPRLKDVKNGDVAPAACGDCDYCRDKIVIKQNEFEII